MSTDELRLRDALDAIQTKADEEELMMRLYRQALSAEKGMMWAADREAVRKLQRLCDADHRYIWGLRSDMTPTLADIPITEVDEPTLELWSPPPGIATK